MGQGFTHINGTSVSHLCICRYFGGAFCKLFILKCQPVLKEVQAIGKFIMKIMIKPQKLFQSFLRYSTADE